VRGRPSTTFHVLVVTKPAKKCWISDYTQPKRACLHSVHKFHANPQFGYERARDARRDDVATEHTTINTRYYKQTRDASCPFCNMLTGRCIFWTTLPLCNVDYYPNIQHTTPFQTKTSLSSNRFYQNFYKDTVAHLFSTWDAVRILYVYTTQFRR
jgi:hypothetical protein